MGISENLIQLYMGISALYNLCLDGEARLRLAASLFSFRLAVVFFFSPDRCYVVVNWPKRNVPKSFDDELLVGCLPPPPPTHPPTPSIRGLMYQRDQSADTNWNVLPR